MSNKLVMVTGGARSGKSTFAEQLSEQWGTKATYIATAQAFDAEMQERISMHRKRRGPGWITREAPFDVVTVLREASAETPVILLDCLTLYVTNHLLRNIQGEQPEMMCSKDCVEVVMKAVRDLTVAAKSVSATVIVVTNEVGMGIVPDNVLSRAFRDVAGFANQCLAEAADEVYIVVSGIPLKLKSSANNECLKGEVVKNG